MWNKPGWRPLCGLCVLLLVRCLPLSRLVTCEYGLWDLWDNAGDASRVLWKGLPFGTRPSSPRPFMPCRLNVCSHNVF